MGIGGEWPLTWVYAKGPIFPDTEEVTGWLHTGCDRPGRSRGVRTYVKGNEAPWFAVWIC